MNGSDFLFVQGRHELFERLVWGAPIQRLLRPVIHKVCNRTERVLIMHIQISALGQELTQQAYCAAAPNAWCAPPVRIRQTYLPPHDQIAHPVPGQQPVVDRGSQHRAAYIAMMGF
jgi:hypothetical protein